MTLINYLRPLKNIILSYPRLIFSLFVVLFLIFYFIPPVWQLQTKKTIKVIRVVKDGKTIEVEVGPGSKDWVTLSKVSRSLPLAIVSAEDGKFYQHAGFDWDQLEAAVTYNWKKKKYLRGASTISQQVIKMAFLTRERSIMRKAREAAGTFFMEKRMTKDEIMTWYINLAEFGEGIYGIKDASRKYFATTPQGLTISQCVHLALILPSPIKWSQSIKKKQLTPFAKKRFELIVTNMRLSGYITLGQWEDSLTNGNFGAPVKLLADRKPENTDILKDELLKLEDDENSASLIEEDKNSNVLELPLLDDSEEEVEKDTETEDDKRVEAPDIPKETDTEEK